MKIIMLGGPGVGKGTQAGLLGAHFKIPNISTGAIIRAAMREGTPLGVLSQEYIKKGLLVPCETVFEIVKVRISQEDCKNGYVLDGFPRTISQAIMLNEHVGPVDVVVNILLDDEEVVKRLGGRRECVGCSAPYHILYHVPTIPNVCDLCGKALITRMDDEINTIRQRLKVYHQTTEKIVEYYRKMGVLVSVYSQEELELTTKLVFEAIGEKYDTH